jgi:hypothetical protein
MTENTTSRFLGNSFSWSKTKIELNDSHPLHGGINVYLPGWTMSQAFVIRAAPGGQETKYKMPLGWDEKKRLCQLCIDQDFLTIEPKNRPGIPDESRPSITLTNRAGEQHTVTKWAGIQDDRFDAIYDVLKQIGERTKDHKPVKERLRPYQKAAIFLGLAGLVVGILFLAHRAANIITDSWWPEKAGGLAGLISLLFAGLLPALLGLRWRERKQSRSDRMGNNLLFLLLLNVLFFTALVTLPSFLWRTGLLLWGETAVAQIQTLSPAPGFDKDTGWPAPYEVSYTVQTETGQQFTRQQNVSHDFFTTLAPDDEISVAYWPLLPRYSLPENNLASNEYAIWVLTTILAVYLLILGGWLAGQAIIRFIDERF